MGSFIFLVDGIKQFIKNKEYEILSVGTFVLVILSLGKHKEDRYLFNKDRFMLPVYPILLSFCAKGMIELRKLKKIMFLAVFTNLLYLFFITNFDKTAALDVMDYLRNDAKELKSV